jgi:hypothetical protein
LLQHPDHVAFYFPISLVARIRSNLWLAGRVDVIGKRLQQLGTVFAENEHKALEEAIKQFTVGPALRSKIAVTKVADND